MAHVELSLSEPNVAGPRTVAAENVGLVLGVLDRWAAAVTQAREPCLLLDADGLVVAASAPCLRLFGTDAAKASGSRLVEIVRLLDFTAASSDLPGREWEKIPPLVPLSSQGLARGLLRVPTSEGATCTLDAVAAPVTDGVRVVGSLTFLSPVGH